MSKYTPPANNVQVHNSRVLVPFTSGYAEGWIEGPPLLQRTPIARPSIRMPYHLWRQAISFLVDVFDNIKCEAQVLFFMKDDDWKLFCPEQEVGAANTDTPKISSFNDQAFAFFASNGYENVGSIHSHCNMAAFASGTDKSDEMDKCDGFHITIGKMSNDVLDYHLRAVVTIIGNEGEKAIRQSIPFNIKDFIDQSPNLALAEELNLPSRIRDQITDWFYFNREEMEEYPEIWTDRVMEKKYAVVTYPTNASQQLGTAKPVWVGGAPVNQTSPPSKDQVPRYVDIQGKTFFVDREGKMHQIETKRECDKKEFEKTADERLAFWEAQQKLREEQDKIDEIEDEKLRQEAEDELQKHYEDIALHL